MNTLTWAFWTGGNATTALGALVRLLGRHYGTQIRRDEFDAAATIALWVALCQACRVSNEILPIPERIDSPESVVVSCLLCSGRRWRPECSETSFIYLLPNQLGQFYAASQRAASGGGSGSPTTTPILLPGLSLERVCFSIDVHTAAPVLLYYQVAGKGQLIAATPPGLALLTSPKINHMVQESE